MSNKKSKNSFPEAAGIQDALLKKVKKRIQIRKALEESERSKSVFLSHLPGLAYRCLNDSEWTMQYVSTGCLALTGYPPESLLQNRDISYNDIIAPEYRALVRDQWAQVLADRQPFRAEYEIVMPGGERKWVIELGEGIFNAKGAVEALEGLILDITKRKTMENHLRSISEHDLLTGLYNHRYLEGYLQKELAMDTVENRALVGINLSALHLLTLQYGFQYSQTILTRIVQILQSCTGQSVLFNAFENHFVYYLKGYPDKNALNAFCEMVTEQLRFILTTERINGSIGIVEINNENKFDVDSLLKNLLLASEKAACSAEKEMPLCFFDEAMCAQAHRDEEIVQTLSEIALGRNTSGLYLQFQPILNTGTHQITEFEALARLNIDRLGNIPPDEFIPLAEKTKLILPLGHEIFTQAFAFLKRLQEHGQDAVGIAVNVSVIQLLRKDFAQQLFELTEKMSLNPEKITLEITESILASNYQEINRVLHSLKELGFKIALDDFGIEYSSLIRLRELHIDILKIDKYFIDDLMGANPVQTITSDIISMGHKLGLRVTAEGIEHELQMECLTKFHCDSIQGYLISKPLDGACALDFLTKFKP